MIGFGIYSMATDKRVGRRRFERVADALKFIRDNGLEDVYVSAIPAS